MLIRAQHWRTRPRSKTGIIGGIDAIQWRPQIALSAISNTSTAGVTIQQTIQGQCWKQQSIKQNGRKRTLLGSSQRHLCRCALCTREQHIFKVNFLVKRYPVRLRADTDVPQEPFLQRAGLRGHLCHSPDGLFRQTLHEIRVVEPRSFHSLGFPLGHSSSLCIFYLIQPYWNPNPPTHHSTIQTPFLRFMYFFVIILMISKVTSPLISGPAASALLQVQKQRRIHSQIGVHLRQRLRDRRQNEGKQPSFTYPIRQRSAGKWI